MSMQDPISDMLTVIRNAQAVGHLTATFSASKVKQAILQVLQQEGYIADFQLITHDNKSNISVTLRYYQGKSVIRKLSRVSKCSRRVYCKHDAIPVVSSGLGISILSTPQGVMTGNQAAAKKIGGEILCTVI